MSAVELKPCPFCGGGAEVSFSHEAGRWDVYEVECEPCVFGLEGPHGYCGDAAKEAAIAAWNNRTPTEDAVERVAAALKNARDWIAYQAPKDAPDRDLALADADKALTALEGGETRSRAQDMGE